MQRRLAVILAADVVGYSRLMGEDEARTLAALDELRDALFEPIVTRHSGNIVKRMGDGWLVEYANVSDAVACAIEIQTGLSDHEIVRLRIGIHVGDASFRDDDVYGDGVNIAARLEALAGPGQVMISDTTYNSLDGKAARQFGGGESRELKNIARSVAVWHWPSEGRPSAAPKPASAETPPSAPQKPSIAVLPLDNMSRDPEQEFFSDGITEDIITDLSKVSGLIVIARNSSFSYKGQALDIRQIGRELDCRYILEGSVRRAGNKVRINAQLIDGVSGGHVWADRFDRDLEDIFAVQDEITREIVDALKVALTAEDESNKQKRGKVDPEAYECYIRGRALIYEFTSESVRKAKVLFERANALDDGLAARALAGVSMIGSTEYYNGWNGAGPGTLKKALELAREAVSLDSREPFAYHALSIALLRSSDFEGAEKAAEKVSELDPNFAGALALAGGVADITERPLEAIELFEKALRLDPKYDVALQMLGRTLFGLGKYQEAERYFHKKLAFASDSDITRLLLAALFGQTGRIGEAREMWAELFTVNPDFSLEHYQSMVLNKNVAWYPALMEGLKKAGLEVEPTNPDEAPK